MWEGVIEEKWDEKYPEDPEGPKDKEWLEGDLEKETGSF